MAINPHEIVTTAAQDNYVELCRVLYGTTLKLAMLPGQTVEHVVATIAAANKIRSLHILCLSFDDDCDAMHARCQKFQESQP